MNELLWQLMQLASLALGALLFVYLLNRKLGYSWHNWPRDTLFVLLATGVGYLFQFVLGLPLDLSLVPMWTLYAVYSYLCKSRNPGAFLPWTLVAVLIHSFSNHFLSSWVYVNPALEGVYLPGYHPIRVVLLMYRSLVEIIAFLFFAQARVGAVVYAIRARPSLLVLMLGAFVMGGVLLDLSPLLLHYPQYLRALEVSFFILYAITISGFVIFARLAEWISRSFELQAQVVRVQQESKDFQNLLDGYDNLRALWHDIKQHFAVLLGHAEAENLPELKRYLVEVLHQDFIPVRDLLFSGHPHLDALLLVKGQQARRLGLELEKKLVVPEVLPMSEPDFGVVMGNILDNAFDALEQVSPEKRYLRLQATIHSGMWVISAENASIGYYRIQGDGSFASTKSGDLHGIGLRHIISKVESV